MRISDVSKITGLGIHTLRFYEKAGLMGDVAKTRGGLRDYGPTDLERLGVIECLKMTGMPLRDIKQFMDWCTMGDKTIRERHDMFVARRRDVDRQMAALKRTRRIIDFKIKYYADALAAGTLHIYDKNKPKLPDFFKA